MRSCTSIRRRSRRAWGLSSSVIGVGSDGSCSVVRGAHDL